MKRLASVLVLLLLCMNLFAEKVYLDNLVKDLQFEYINGHLGHDFRPAVAMTAANE